MGSNHPSAASIELTPAVRASARSEQVDHRDRDSGTDTAAKQAERPLIARLTLHAEKLRLTNLDGHPLEIIAPLPKDFRAMLNQLRRHGRS